MIHIQKEIPEHPVIEAMERFGEYPVRARLGNVGAGIARPRAAGRRPYEGMDEGAVACGRFVNRPYGCGREVGRGYGGKKAVYLLQVVL